MLKHALRLGLMVCLLTSVTQAAVIMDTTASASSTGSGVKYLDWQGSRFTTGSAGTTVRTIAPVLTSSSSTTNVTNMSVKLFAADGTGGRPGTLLGTFSFYNFNDDLDRVYCTNAAGVALSASTDYWYVAAPVAGEDYTFISKISGSPVYTGGMTGYEADNTIGGRSTNEGGSWFTYSSTAERVYMDTEVVPEPATMSLLGLSAVALLRKRRRK